MSRPNIDTAVDVTCESELGKLRLWRRYLRSLGVILTQDQRQLFEPFVTEANEDKWAFLLQRGRKRRQDN